MGSSECYCNICDELKWIRINCNECGACICEDCRENMIDEMCEECYEKDPILETLNYSIDLASEYGHLEVVKYLHSINKDCTASENGHLEIGKDCTEFAIDQASKNGHIVKYLHSKQKMYKIGYGLC
jgi:hypothetical protein